jgi:hypothetical protein
VILVNRKLRGIFRAIKSEDRTRGVRQSGLRPNLESAGGFIRSGTRSKFAFAPDGPVPREAKTILAAEPRHIVRRPPEWRKAGY